MSEGPAPEITEVNAPYWDALEAGLLRYQHCRGCGQNQLPPRHECTTCLGDDIEWRSATGRGRLISWVEYHRAYDPAFADAVPYNVAIVELEEGPRLVTNIETQDPEALRIDQPVTFRPARRFGRGIAGFVPA